MLKEPHRKKQALTKEEITAVLLRNSSGVLCLVDEDGYPYPVPLSYAYAPGKLYFHCAKRGQKLDALAHCEKASFCVIDRDDVLAAEFATAYISVIAQGKARLISDDDEKRLAINLIGDKYGTGDIAAKEHEIEKTWKAFDIICLDIEDVSGKAAKAVIENREAYFPQGGKACSCVSQ